MAMTVGELLATFDLDPDPARRAMLQAELAMRGLQRSTDGSIRDMRGRYVSLSRSLDDVTRHTNRTGDASRRASRDMGRLGGLGGMVRGLGSALGSAAAQAARAASMLGAAVPAAAGLVGALVNIVPAAALATTAILSVAQAVGALKIGGSGVGDALTAAFADAGAAAGGAAGGTNQHAQAVRAVADAERALRDAQKAARQAQLELNAARKQGARDLQDMNNALASAQLDEQQAILDVKDAEEELNRVKNSDSSEEERARAQLAYDQAVQRLKEQRIETARLREDTAAANKAGVEGTDAVTQAKERLAQAERDVEDRMRAVADAQEALAQGAGGGGGAGGVDALAAALAKLSPAARAFVQAVIALKPAWDALRLDVQEALFKGLAGELRTTAGALLPLLRRELVNSATALNTMAKGVLGSARELAQNGTLGRAMASASQGLHNLSGVPGVVVTAFGQLAAAAGPSFERLTAQAGDAAARIGENLSQAFEDGRLQAAIEQAISLIGDMAEVAGNVFSIFGSIFSASSASGGAFIGMLQTITGALADAFASQPVQAGLKALFETMSVLAQTAAPLLVQALSVIGPVLVALGPPAQTLIKAFADGLEPVIRALGPVLFAAAGAVGSLVEAAAPLLVVVGELVAAVLPALTPLLDAVAVVARALAPIVRQLATVLGATLAPVIAGLSDVIGEMAEQTANALVDALEQLLPLIPMLIPAFEETGRSLGEILTALAPLLPQLALLGTEIMTQLMPALIPLIPPLVQLSVIMLRLATVVIRDAVVPALEMIIKGLGAFKDAMQPTIDAVTGLTEGIRDAFQWLYDILVGHSIIPDLVREIVQWFTGLPGKTLAALTAFPGALASLASRAGTRMVDAIADGVRSAVRSVASLPGRALSALGDLSRYLYDSGRALMRGFIEGIKSQLSAVKDAAKSVLDGARSLFPFSPAKEGPFAGRGWTLYSGHSIGDALAAGLSSRQGLVADAARSLMAAAHIGTPEMGLPAGAALAGGGALAGGPGGGGGGVHTIRLEWSGPEAMTRLIRGVVSDTGGGDVQLTFGSRR
ncbi:hypothetical protein AB0M28_13410 [Streptomyces sp. NPDC051940]|uniref:hypothetical protein n=1 Tax=Streptomyces sp. NPDC051940 TaxID=3155675 RepID=UPI00342A2CBE